MITTEKRLIFFYKYIENCKYEEDKVLYRVAFKMALDQTPKRQTCVNNDIKLSGSNNEHGVIFLKGELFGTLLQYELTKDQEERARAKQGTFSDLLDEALEEPEYDFAGVKFDGVEGFIRETIERLFKADVVAEDLLPRSNSPAGGSRRNTRRSRRGRRFTRKH